MGGMSRASSKGVTEMTYIVETSNYDAARPFCVRCTTQGVINAVKGRYTTKAAANARRRSLERS